MHRSWSRRWGTAALAVLLVVQTGCGGGWQSLGREELASSAPAKSYRVTMKNGDQMTFISLHMEGNSLVGTRRITVVETVGEDEGQRSNVTNRYEETRLPWEDVALVEGDVGRRNDHSLWLAAGAIVAGVGTFLILTGDSAQTPTDDGGGTKK